MTSAVGIEKPLVYKENTEAKGLLLYVRIGLTYRCQSLGFVQAQSGSNGQEMTASGESKLQTNQPEINRQCHRFHVKKKRKKDNTCCCRGRGDYRADDSRSTLKHKHLQFFCHGSLIHQRWQMKSSTPRWTKVSCDLTIITNPQQVADSTEKQSFPKCHMAGHFTSHDFLLAWKLNLKVV